MWGEMERGHGRSEWRFERERVPGLLGAARATGPHVAGKVCTCLMWMMASAVAPCPHCSRSLTSTSIAGPFLTTTTQEILHTRPCEAHAQSLTVSGNIRLYWARESRADARTPGSSYHIYRAIIRSAKPHDAQHVP